jgi:amino acid transporter
MAQLVRIGLARKLRTTDYFTLAFGTMVGVGWLVVMDDWLGRGGPLGAILGFAIGGAALLPIGYVYGRLVTAMPDAGSEMAYTGRVFSPAVSFATGWMMTLAYGIVCPWEAVAIGKMAAYLFPALDAIELYQVAGRPVYLPHLLLGLGLITVIAAINYRGVRASANFQNWTTFGLLLLFGVVVALGLARGSPRHLAPLFSRGRLVSTLLVLQIVPYFMTGFEAVPKCAEEARPTFRARGFFRAILLAILLGSLFYTLAVAVVAYVAPWQALTASRFATAVAFERSLGSRWIVGLIFAAAGLSLLKVFNGNFVAASRLLFALGRAGLDDPRLGQVHPSHQTPTFAIVCAGLLTAAVALLGETILIPVTEVGSMASALGWLAACAAYARMETRSRERAVAVLGMAIAFLLVLMKLLPFVPGHFSVHEYLVLALWCLAGVLLKRRASLAETHTR